MSSKLILNNYRINRKMPENYVEGELDFCKNEFAYDTYKVELVELKNCIVNKKGFVYEQSKYKLNKISLLDEKRYIHLLGIKHYLKKVFVKRKRKLSNEKYLLAFDEWTSEHYHWFCDFLPRLFVIKNQIENYTLLLPHSNYTKNIGLKSLDFFNIKPARIEFIEEKELVKIKDLSIITHTCLTGYINDKILMDIKHFISAKLDIKQTPEKKLYISRDKARYRKVLNEQEIQNIAIKNGYEIVYYEDLPWEQQINFTANAKSIVSIHGAGLVNTLFLQDTAKVLEFRRNKIYHNQCFWHLSAALQHKYYYLFGTPDNDELVLEGGDCCNLTIDAIEFEKTLQFMDSQ